VFLDSFRIFRRNAPLFMLVSGLGAIPTALEDLETFRVGGLVAATFINPLPTAIIMYIAMRNFLSGTPTAAETLSRARGAYFPLLQLFLFYAVLFGPFYFFDLDFPEPSEDSSIWMLLLESAALCALIVLLFALIYFSCTVWYLGSPVCVAEITGLTQTLRRSSALTKGVRGRICLLFVFTVGPLIAAPSLAQSVVDQGNLLGQIAVHIAWYSVFSSFADVASAVAYCYLQEAKRSETAEIFA
jgi:hypothetical protein